MCRLSDNFWNNCTFLARFFWAGRKWRWWGVLAIAWPSPWPQIARHELSQRIHRQTNLPHWCRAGIYSQHYRQSQLEQLHLVPKIVLSSTNNDQQPPTTDNTTVFLLGYRRVGTLGWPPNCKKDNRRVLHETRQSTTLTASSHQGVLQLCRQLQFGVIQTLDSTALRRAWDRVKRRSIVEMVMLKYGLAMSSNNNNTFTLFAWY